MSKGLCLALAMALAAAATPAAAQTFETFKKFCLVTGGEPAGVRSALDQAGWERDPRAANLPAGTSMTLFSDPSAAAPEMALVGFMPSQSGLSLPSCSVMGPASMGELEEQMSDWVGFEPGRTAQGTTLWVYTNGPDGPTPQPDLVDAGDGPLLTAARSRGVIYVTQVRLAQAGSFLLHFSVAPDVAILPTH